MIDDSHLFARIGDGKVSYNHTTSQVSPYNDVKKSTSISPSYCNSSSKRNFPPPPPPKGEPKKWNTLLLLLLFPLAPRHRPTGGPTCKPRSEHAFPNEKRRKEKAEIGGESFCGEIRLGGERRLQLLSRSNHRRHRHSHQQQQQHYIVNQPEKAASAQRVLGE